MSNRFDDNDKIKLKEQWNAIMATAVVASIPAAVLLVVAQRYVAAGVTSGAVKD